METGHNPKVNQYNYMEKESENQSREVSEVSRARMCGSTFVTEALTRSQIIIIIFLFFYFFKASV